MDFVWFYGSRVFSQATYCRVGCWLAVDSGRVKLNCVWMFSETAHSRLRGRWTLSLLCFYLVCLGLGYNWW